jgi:hypothetical protein
MKNTSVGYSQIIQSVLQYHAGAAYTQKALYTDGYLLQNKWYDGNADNSEVQNVKETAAEWTFVHDQSIRDDLQTKIKNIICENRTSLLGLLLCWSALPLHGMMTLWN